MLFCAMYVQVSKVPVCLQKSYTQAWSFLNTQSRVTDLWEMKGISRRMLMIIIISHNILFISMMDVFCWCLTYEAAMRHWFGMIWPTVVSKHVNAKTSVDDSPLDSTVSSKITSVSTFYNRYPLLLDLLVSIQGIGWHWKHITSWNVFDGILFDLH